MPVDLDNSSAASGETSVSGNQPPQKQTPSMSVAIAKKKRNLPGMPGKEKSILVELEALSVLV